MLLSRRNKTTTSSEGGTAAVSVADMDLRAAGQVCPRCQQTIGAVDEVRRNAAGDWVHQAC